MADSSVEDKGLLMVVDDTPANLYALLPTLEAAGFDVLVATNGHQALQRAAIGAPHLILLDVLMPGMDGFETCRRLKADPALRDIPVIFMTSLSDTREKVAAFEVGAADYVTKPFDSAEVLERVRTHVTLQRLRRTLELRNTQLEATTTQLQTITDALTRFLQTGSLTAASRQLLESALRRVGGSCGFIGMRAGLGVEVLAVHSPPEPGSALHGRFRALHDGQRDGRVCTHAELADLIGATTLTVAVDSALGCHSFPVVQRDNVIGWLVVCGPALRIDGDERRAIGQLLHSIGVLYAYERLEQQEAESQRRRQKAEDTVNVLAEEIRAHHQVGCIVGDSQVLRHVLAQIERIAPTDGTVLLLGETGTGKELFARALHELSPRHAKPLIRVNCAAIPENLVESELFGHEKGAFTGATAQRKGRFELADGGTLFLDEVGDMPLAAQSKLLRVLQEREFERVGGQQTIRSDVRVLAATHHDLRALVDEGRFREDLFYRLNVVPVRIPPLRDRRGDVTTLAHLFVNRFNTRHGKQVRQIAEPGLQRLAAYHWPGNVRELENVIERAVILSDGPILDLADVFLPETSSSPAAATDAKVAADAPNSEPASFSGTVAELQHDYILRTLEETRWVIEGAAGAAARLGLKPSTLRNRLQRLGIHKVGRSSGE